MSFLGLSPTMTEVLGNALAFACIFLIARNSVWNWPVGILNCVFYIALFYPARLYGDSALQVVYIVLSLVGLYQWLFGRGGVQRRMEGADTSRPITRASGSELATYAAGFVVLIVALGFLLDLFTDTDVPWWDGVTTAGCLTATWILAFRKIENWWVWIGTNVSYFFLYQHKGLIITQWCQIVFLGLSVAGLIRWQKELESQPVAVTA